MTVPRPVPQIASPDGNIWAGVSDQPKLAIVLHTMQGTFDGCLSWFASPAAQASANFGVARDGRVAMFVDPEGPNSPYANGAVQNPDAIVQALLRRVNFRNLNFLTLSIEHEDNGIAGLTLTPEQLHASSQIAAYYIQRYGLPAASLDDLDNGTLIGHFEIDSVTRLHCPGWPRQQWLDYETAVLGWLLAPVSDPLAALRAQYAALQQTNATLHQQLTAAAAATQQAQFQFALIRDLAATPPDDAAVYTALTKLYQALNGGGS